MTKGTDAKRDALPVINDFQLITPFTNSNSGFARWAFCRRDRQNYFIKEFLSPVCPREDAVLPPEILKRKRNISIEFYQRKRQLYDRLNACDTGNIVLIRSFFLYETKYYIVTDRIDAEALSPSVVASMPECVKLIFFKVLANCLHSLHRHSVVHADLKPENIMLKKTVGDMLTAKLIDFDSSFLVSQQPEAADLQGDQAYMAPEVCLAMNGEDVKLTAAADIFSLGLLYHVYYTGKLPLYSSAYAYAHEALLDGQALRLSPALPSALTNLLSDMLLTDPAKRPDAQSVLSRLQFVNPASGGAPPDMARVLDVPDKPGYRTPPQWKIPTDL